jgi:F0F1-type ATP synthase epsilon subunit
MAMRQDASTGQMVEDTSTAAAETEEPKDPKKLTLDIKVYAAFQVYYEGKGYSISAVNETGPFDVLPKHHNFLCILVPCTLLIKTPTGDKRIKIARALMHVRSNKVTVFIDV